MRKNINEFLEQILNGEKNPQAYCDYLDDGMEYFEENYDGFLDSKKLSSFIDKSRKNKKLQFILSGLLYCSNKESITDDIFKKLSKFRSGLKRTYYGVLGHCNISFYQLSEINKMQLGMEAFGWLTYHMYTSDAFSTEDILRCLKESLYLKRIWNDTFKYLLSLENGSTLKKELISDLLSDKRTIY